MNSTGIRMTVAAAIVACLGLRLNGPLLAASATGNAKATVGRSTPVVTQYAYGDDGLLKAYIDAAGRQASYRYADGRLKRIEYADGTSVEYVYDAFGRRVEMKDRTGTTRYQYDNLSRLIRVDQSNGLWAEFEYDDYDRLTAIRMPGSDEGKKGVWQVTYGYDYLGRLVSLRTPIGEFTWSYDPVGAKVVRTMPNGVTSTFAYDPRGQLRSIRHAAKDRRPIIQFDYTYEPTGCLASETETTPQGKHLTEYVYDLGGRLILVKQSDGSAVAYTYDEFDNRLSKTETAADGTTARTAYAYDGRDRILKAGDVTFGHDAAGNLIERRGGAEKALCAYDCMNRLLSTEAAGRKVTFVHDGDGLLVRRETADRKVEYLALPFGDSYRVAAAFPQRATPKHYVLAATALAGQVGASCEFYLEDRLGSVRVVTDADAQVTERIAYGPYGQLRTTTRDLGLGYAYAGLVYDHTSSVYVTRARAYDPRLGRFLQADPERDRPNAWHVGFSSYAYCGGDPVNLVDLDGARPTWADIVDINSSKQWYADAAKTAIASASNRNWVWAGVRATLFDLVGGFIPGEAKNQGQARAAAAWSLASMLTGMGEVSLALKGLGVGRTTFSSVANSATGHPFRAALDIVGLGGTSAGLRAGSMRAGSFVGEGGQRVFNFLSETSMRHADAWQQASQWVTAEGIGRQAWGLATYESPREACVGREASLGEMRISTRLGWRDEYMPPSDDGGGGALVPTPVGGVYLGGAAKAIADLGDICGVSSDGATGRIALLSRQPGKDVTLPKIELGDFAVVMRSVFRHHQAPTVTIDPDPRDPYGPIQIPKNSPGTEDTRVGWILFQADRLMKCYGVNRDNITGRPIGSRIPGFEDMLTAALRRPDFKPGETWHRFWLEPLPIRMTGAESMAALFESPGIYVKIQRMEQRGGVFVPAGWVDHDPLAEPFKRWFTDHYDAIGHEEYTQLPDPVHPDRKIAIFPELRRIAGLVAVAEQLKEKGVRPPQWLLDYPSERYPTPRTTPAIDTERRLGDRVEQTHGGVDLAPLFVKAPLPDKPSPVVAELRAAVAREAKQVSEPAAVGFAAAGAKYRAVVLPSSDARAVGAFRQAVADLDVPLDGVRSLPLKRSYCSFFNEPTCLGRGWRLSLPRLNLNLVEARREGSRIVMNANAAFLADAYGKVEEAFVPSPAAASREFIDLVSAQKGSRGRLTYQKSRTRPGQAVYHLEYARDDYMDFVDDGSLLTRVANGVQTEYMLAGPKGGPFRVTGAKALTRDGSVEYNIDYDPRGRIVKAASSSGQTATYIYDDHGLLVQMKSASGTTEYRYNEAGLLTGILRDGRLASSIRYNDRGQIVSLADASGRTADLLIEPMGEGGAAATWKTSEGWSKTFYDASMRMAGAEDSRGNRWQNRFGPDGDLEQVTYTAPTGARAVASRRGDSVQLSVNDRTVLNLFTEGLPGVIRARQGSRDVRLQYDPAGRARLLTLAPADGAGEAVTITYSENGALSNVRIGSTELMSSRLGRDGLPEQIRTSRATLNITWNRDTSLPSVIKSSDGCEWDFAYDAKAPKSLRKLIAIRGSLKSTVWFSDGLPVEVRDFDGARTVYAYEPAPGAAAGAAGQRRVLKAMVDPLGRKTDFEHDSSGRLKRITIQGQRSIKWIYGADTIKVIESSLPLEVSMIRPWRVPATVVN